VAVRWQRPTPSRAGGVGRSSSGVWIRADHRRIGAGTGLDSPCETHVLSGMRFSMRATSRALLYLPRLNRIGQSHIRSRPIIERELSGKPIPVNRVGLAVTLCLHQLNAARAIGRAYDAQFSGSDSIGVRASRRCTEVCRQSREAASTSRSILRADYITSVGRKNAQFAS